MDDLVQEAVGDFRVRLRLSSHSSNGTQEYECGTLGNSGQPVDGTQTGISPFVDLLAETPSSVPMSVECPITDIGETDHQVHLSFRARRQPGTGTSSSATGTAVLTQLSMTREA